MNRLRETPPLFSYRRHWAACFGPAPFLPMSLREMGELGWGRCDVILITGDAYVDHPSFGAAIIGRLLEAQGFRVGLIAQPDWRDTNDFRALGQPGLFFGVTAGNMDSMVNRYTADGRKRSNDAYSPDDEGGRRPDRASIVYSQRAREAYRETPIILGGIEASLRRLAHYDYWSDQVRRSILLDAKADLLLYGNAERALVDVAHRIAAGEHPATIRDLRGTAFVTSDGGETADPPAGDNAVWLPSHQQVRTDPDQHAQAARIIRQETNPYNARTLVQPHGNQQVWVHPPPKPLTTEELDAVYELPFGRAPHPAYAGRHIPAWEMIRFSVNIMRGCFGGCTFCSITEHEGRIIQSRSEDSILREIEQIRERTAGFTGFISDLGGPSANMYRMGCRDPEAEASCRRMSCIAPSICRNLDTSHESLIHLYRRVREHPAVKKAVVASGVRYDLAVRSKTYVRELVQHHVGGYLKLAPEHTESGPLQQMLKPGIDSYHRFKELFDQYSRRAGKEQFIIPYFIAAHPGTRDEDMLELALWLKRNGYRPDQVQAFLPTPMALATAMYYTGRTPLRRIGADGGEPITTPRGLRKRRLHKAFLRYHDPENWPMLRRALREMGRADLIGKSKRHLVPLHQPPGTGGSGEGQRRPAQPAKGAKARHANRRGRHQR